MENSVNSHYVPQFYLRGFKANTENRIFVYEKGRGQHRKHKAIKSVAMETGFYSVHTEQALSVIENHVAPVLDKIRNQQPITLDDKAIIATFIAIMIRRVPKGWNQLQTIAHDPEKICNDIEANSPHLHSELKEIRQGMQQMPDEWKNAFPRNLWDWSLVNYIPHQIILALSRMTWRFCVSDKPAFVTSDNPVAHYNIGSLNGTVRFPISSYIALEATNWQVGPDLAFPPTHESEIMGINQWIVEAAPRYIYHDGNVEWVLQRLDL